MPAASTSHPRDSTTQVGRRADTGGNRFLGIKDVVAETSLSCATIYRLIARGEFPEQIRVSPQRVAWSERAISAWKEGRSGGPPS
jgi:prophage regulatory protein